MGNIEPTPEMKKYIRQFTINARNSLKNGTIELIMIYGSKCPVCHMQFAMVFKRDLEITFDDNASKEGKKNKEKIADKILPVLEDEPLGMKLIAESEAWAKEMKDRDLAITYTPTFIDFKTHEIVGVGMKNVDMVEKMIDPTQRVKAREMFVKKMEAKKKSNCNAVACGLPQQFVVKHEDEEEEEEKTNDGKQDKKSKKKE